MKRHFIPFGYKRERYKETLVSKHSRTNTVHLFLTTITIIIYNYYHKLFLKTPHFIILIQYSTLRYAFTFFLRTKFVVFCSNLQGRPMLHTRCAGKFSELFSLIDIESENCSNSWCKSLHCRSSYEINTFKSYK